MYIQNPPLTYGPHTLTGESTDAGGGSPHQKLDKLITKHTDIMRTNSDTVAVFQSGLLWSDKLFSKFGFPMAELTSAVVLRAMHRALFVLPVELQRQADGFEESDPSGRAQ